MAGALRHMIQRGDAFWARIVVPPSLRPIIGKTELRRRLGGNRKLAERDLHAAVAAMQDQLAAAQAKLDVSAAPPPRMRSRPLTVAQIAHTHFAAETALDASQRDRTAQPVAWPVVRDFITPDGRSETVGPLLPQPSPDWSEAIPRADLTVFQAAHRDALARVAAGKAENAEVAAVIGWAVDRFRERGNTAAQPGTTEWRALARTLAQVQLEALGATIERDAGREPAAPTLPILAETPVASVTPTRSRGPAVSILDLLHGYLRTLQAQGMGAEAERRWTPTFKALVRHLGHDDARHLTKADVAGWRDHLLETEKLAPKTIRDVYLASLRAVLGWAADNDKIPENPATRVRIDVAKKVRTRERGLNDFEAVAVLKAAHSYQPPAGRSTSTRESLHTTAAKRWLPWLCALTGARIAEMAQLRGQDIHTRDGITFIRITPDAGSVKSGHYRDVPVHPQLVSLGFLDFAQAAGDQPLFFDTAKVRRSPQHPSKIVAIHLAAWVRSLGAIDEEVDPSHGWRHRFKTVGREAEISDRVLDAIQGHAGRTAGDDYGDVTLKTRDAAICRIPNYQI